MQDLLGRDSNSWGLNHQGKICHNGISEQFCKPFENSKPAKVGMLFNGLDGTLAYFVNGIFLGVAFRDISRSGEELFPIVCSPARKSEMTLCNTKRYLGSLEERCRSSIMELVTSYENLDTLPLPKNIKKYLAEALIRKT